MIAVIPGTPFLQGVGTVDVGFGARTPTWPSGTQAGDIGWLAVVVAGATSIGLSTASGFTLFTTVTNGTNVTEYYWCRASSSSPSSPVTNTGFSNAEYAQIITFRSCVATGNPYEAGSVGNGNSSSVSVAGNTTTVDNQLVVTFIGEAAFSASLSSYANSSLANLAGIVDGNAGSSFGNTGLAAFMGTFLAHGTFGTTTATMSTALRWMALTVSLLPGPSQTVVAPQTVPAFGTYAPRFPYSGGDDYVIVVAPRAPAPDGTAATQFVPFPRQVIPPPPFVRGNRNALARPPSVIPAPVYQPAVNYKPPFPYPAPRVPPRTSYGRSVFPPPANPIEPYGPAGAGTFVVQVETGFQVTYEFDTEVQKSWDGTEHRIAQLPPLPRETYSGTAILVDGDSRDVRSRIVQAAAQGSVFLLGLAHEEATFTAPAVTNIITVANTSILDWAQVTQRVIVIGFDGTSIQASIQSVVGNQMTLGDAVTGTALSSLPGVLASVGARIMPLVPVYLDPQQAFGRHPVGAEEWSIVARNAFYGYVGSSVFGRSGAPTMYTDPTWGSTPVWDRMLNADDMVTDSVQTLADLVDLGGIPVNVGSAPVVDYGRQLVFKGGSVSFQWMKSFIALVRGQQCRFFAPTGRNDLALSSNPGGATVIVKNGTGYGDPSQFFNGSTAQSRLWVTKTDGTTQVVAVLSYSDNLNGTGTIGLDTSITGTIAMLSFLETCRFNDDKFQITFDGPTFNFAQLARVVQQ